MHRSNTHAYMPLGEGEAIKIGPLYSYMKLKLFLLPKLSTSSRSEKILKKFVYEPK